MSSVQIIDAGYVKFNIVKRICSTERGQLITSFQCAGWNFERQDSDPDFNEYVVQLSIILKADDSPQNYMPRNVVTEPVKCAKCAIL